MSTGEPHLPFERTATEELGQNAIVIRVQPDEGVTIRFGEKVPGTQMEVRDVTMDFGYGHSFSESSPEAYERLILDVLLGEPSLFPRHEEVELSWQILDPITEYWASKGAPEQYASGGWAPASADEMMAWCNERISHHKVPARIRIVEEFPMTVTGKIQKFAMREAEQEALASEPIRPAAASAPAIVRAT